MGVFFTLIFFSGSLGAIGSEDIAFCYQKELWGLLSHYEPEIRQLLVKNPGDDLFYDVLEDMALLRQDDIGYIEVLIMRVENLQKMADAQRLLSHLAERRTSEFPATTEQNIKERLREIFPEQGEQILLDRASGVINEEEMIDRMKVLNSYPEYFDDFLQSYINEIAVERNDSLRIDLCEVFSRQYPASRWQDTNTYFQLISLLNMQKYSEVSSAIEDTLELSPVLAYLISGLLIDAGLRRNLEEGESNQQLLERALTILEEVEFPADRETISVIYQKWDKTFWNQKIVLQKAKIIYHQIIAQKGFWGDEDLIAYILERPDQHYERGFGFLHTLDPPNNDFGEIAELNYWLGRYAVLLQNDTHTTRTAEYFIDCLIAGAPRKRFDPSAEKYLNYLHSLADTEDDLMTWSRKIKNYSGPIFTDVTDQTGLSGSRYTRVSIGDFNNDGRADLLFNGHRLYRNEGDFLFTDVTGISGIENHSYTGGLWADFDQDGLLDFVALSSSSEEPGDALYRNMGDGRFARLAEEDYLINDYSPTEGAAWIDIDRTGYPSLYTANYEKWQVQTGYQDYFWYNEQGKFSDQTAQLGLLEPAYTRDPGLAGRGVSPADYKNNGRQSIFVSNYRLNRNYLWDWQSVRFADNAALFGVAGHKFRIPNQNGYFGHTIGADWGDFNNNGRLDLFIANLAHPRFIEFSDISMLLRNDGLVSRSIGNNALVYYKFTDVTKEAGISFDELHSEPNWFDADNDGFLDLFITSVYENDRSYLYLNNRDGTFTEITWLSGVRVYNGWGNSVADLNNNGRVDLVVGSGNGVKIFRNDTVNNYQSVFYKPVWNEGEMRIINRDIQNSSIPNSPAFGTKVIVKVLLSGGEELTLIRELNGGKGTTSQNDQFLHFGIRDGRLISAEIWQP